MVGPVVAVPQRHCDETAAVPLGAGHQCAARCLGIAGFQADAALHLPQQAVVVLHGALADGNGAAGRLLHGRRGQHRHIPGRGIVPLGVQSVGIGEAGMGHAQCRRLFIHQCYEQLQPSGALRQGQRRVVAGAQQQAVQQLLHPHRFAGLQVHGRALGHVLPRHGNGVVRLCLLQRHQRRHDLGGAGNEHLLIAILFVEQLPRVRVQQDSSRGGDLHSLRHSRYDTQEQA